MTPGEFLGGLLHAVTQAHVLHLATGSFAEHVALGELYEGLGPAVDELAEVVQGAEGKVADWPVKFDLDSEQEPLEFAKGLQGFINDNREELSDATQVQNLVDGVLAIVDRAVYKIGELA